MKTTDNNCGKSVKEELLDKENSDKFDEIIDDLTYISKIEIGKNDNIVFFPDIQKEHKDNIENEHIFTLSNNSNDIKLETGNIAGFVGYNNTELSITSRFTEEEKPDYFLHYMLCQVLHINITKDLKHSIDSDNNSFSFYPYLFIYYLQEAYSQGIYKKYKRYDYNDSKIKGIIDFNRHIKNNFMNNGKVAYYTREYSYDNDVTQLIRHTIEYIKNNKKYSFIFSNNDIKKMINTYMFHTPSYAKNKLQAILSKNMKPISHPYYTNYENLRKICISILLQEELKYGADNDKIYGILFDVSYLWEEYLYKVMLDSKDLNNITHPRNKDNYNPIYLLQNNKWKSYPDFYVKNKVVMDAKYKNNNDISNIDISDRYQLLSYMFILNANKGIFLQPSNTIKENCEEKEICNIDSENNNNREVCLYSFYIPQNKNNMDDFIKEIQKSEQEFKSKLSSLCMLQYNNLK